MLLAIDSSTQTVGIALFDGAQVVGEIIWQTKNHHTVELAPAINELCKKCDVGFSEFRGIGVAAGPGSYTSLRIGYAIAKGLALSLHIPAIAIPTLEILVAAQPLRDIPLFAALHAGRNRYAIGKFTAQSKKWVADDKIEIKKIDEIVNMTSTPAIMCGEINAEDRQFLLKNNKNYILALPVQSVRRPSYLAYLAWRKLKTGKFDDVRKISPTYLQNPQSTG